MYEYNPLSKSHLLPPVDIASSGGTSDDVGNASNVSGSTITDGLNTLNTDINNLQATTFKITYYELIDISTGTSGSLVQTPAGATINQGEFGPSGNSVLSTINGSSNLLYETPLDTSSQPITINLDVNGNWSTNSVYPDPVAIIYSLNISLQDWNNLTPSFTIDYFTLSARIESVTGDGVDNTDSANPVLSFPTLNEIGAASQLDLQQLQQIDVEKGGVIFTDTQFTESNRLIASANQLVQIPNNKGTILLTTGPPNAANWANVNGELVPETGNNDEYFARLTFECDPTLNNRNLRLFLDIGSGSLIDILGESKRLERGAGNDTSIMFTFPYFTGPTFLANNGRIFCQVDGDWSGYDFNLYLIRIKKNLIGI